MATGKGTGRRGAARLSTGRAGSTDLKLEVEPTVSPWCRRDDTDPPGLRARARARAAGETETVSKDPLTEAQ